MIEWDLVIRLPDLDDLTLFYFLLVTRVGDFDLLLRVGDFDLILRVGDFDWSLLLNILVLLFPRIFLF